MRFVRFGRVLVHFFFTSSPLGAMSVDGGRYPRTLVRGRRGDHAGEIDVVQS